MKTEFDTSVPMSTYLVALVISDFVCLNDTVQGIGAYGKVDVNVCGRSNAIEQLTYALKVSTKIIKFFESIYGVEYPLPKCGNNRIIKIKFTFKLNFNFKIISLYPTLMQVQWKTGALFYIENQFYSLIQQLVQNPHNNKQW